MPEYNSPLSLDCIAVDPTSTTLYGIASGWSRDSNKESFLLVKSIPNPDHVSLTMWSMVSETESGPFSYWSPPFGTVDCTVSSKGVYTAFFRNGNYLTPGSSSIPVGVRYDPATQKWTSIRTLPYYGWTSDRLTHTSFYVNNNGVETLMHLLTDDEGSFIRFGVLNETENFLQLSSVWTWDHIMKWYTYSDEFDIVPRTWFSWYDPYLYLGAFGKSRLQDDRKMIYANDRLYMMHYNSISNVTIEAFRFKDFTTRGPPPSSQVFKGPENFRSNYFFTGTRGSTTFLGGLGSYKKTNLTEEYSSFTMDLADGAPQTPIVYTSPFYNRTFDEFADKYGDTRRTDTMAIHDNFVSVGGNLPGQNPFVVGLASEGVFEFSIVGKNGTTDLGMVAVIVPGYFSSIYHRAQNLIDYLRDLSYKQTNVKHKLTTWEIIGIVVACFAGLFVIIKLNRRRNNRATADSQQQQQNQDMELSVWETNAGTSAAHPVVIAYEEQVANQYFNRDSQPNLVTSAGDSHPTLSAYGGDDGQTPVYTQHPRPNVVTYLGGDAQS